MYNKLNDKKQRILKYNCSYKIEIKTKYEIISDIKSILILDCIEDIKYKIL